MCIYITVYIYFNATLSVHTTLSFHWWVHKSILYFRETPFLTGIHKSSNVL